MLLKDFAHCLASGIVYTLYKSRLKEKDYAVYVPLVPGTAPHGGGGGLWRGGGTGTQQQQDCTAAMDMFRWFGGIVVLRMGTQQDCTRRKKSLRKNKSRISLKKKRDKRSDNKKKKKKFCPYLIICKLFRVFI